MWCFMKKTNNKIHPAPNTTIKRFQTVYGNNEKNVNKSYKM